MKVRNKIIIGAVAVLIIILLSITAGFFIGKKIYDKKPEPVKPEPGKETVIRIIEGAPGVIVIKNELFFEDKFTAEIESSGIGKAEQVVYRPDSWREHRKNHFIALGIVGNIVDRSYLYGGFMQYRYRFFREYSILVQYFLSMNHDRQYDTGLKFGFEVGVK